jgi:SAM-dependent methyltransferase
LPSLDWNKRHWGTDYHWDDGGEAWSQSWGSSEAQWYGSLYPRVHRHLPTKAILEIAPGHGRWTRFLLPLCEKFVGVDLNETTTAVCRDRFSDQPHARFMTNDGLSLDMVPAGQFDFVFCFDSLVHAEIDVMQSYLRQIIRKLKPGGAAFVHHSHFGAGDIDRPNPHGRGVTVSAEAVAQIITDNAGVVMVQEAVTWEDAKLLDCLTTFCPAASYFGRAPQRFDNPLFMLEATFIKKYYAAYQR